MSEIRAVRYGYHHDWLRRHAERTPDKLSMVDLATGQQLTYAGLNARANRLATWLRDDAGLEQGDRISILARNSADYFVVLFACGKLGLILNTLNWRLAVPELAYIVGDCTPRLLIYEPEFGPVVDELAAGYPIEKLLCLGADAPAGGATLPDALRAASPEDFEGPRLTYEDTWAILYTSGTTGRPKGAQVTYGNFFYNAVGMGQAISLTSDDINLLTLPTFHVGGLGLYAMPVLHAGGTVLVMRDFHPAELLRLIEQWRATVILLVPSMYLMLQDEAGLETRDLSSMRLWSSGGSPLPPALVQSYAERGVVIQQGMGMTETGPTVFLVPKADALRKAGSVGKPVLHTDVCIMDQNDRMLGPNEIGELCIRGSITTGYWNAPDKTAETIRDGWLHSGDAAKYDDEGFFYIVDRWKDMFISGGENVYPAEVENVFYEHPAVAEVAVIGVPHPRWQEVGHAVVVVKPGRQASGDELIAFCQGKLARYKIPKAVTIVDELPRNDLGKVMKNVLREQLSSEAAS